MLRSMSNSISRCSLGASYVGDLMLQRSMKSLCLDGDKNLFKSSVVSSSIRILNYIQNDL
ncbi:hypothetical protein MtrunA17_Chr3g0112561 [Medicago truncatula]|uniref:Uncharacterized protein n=1 Tax=Medicago truncatula TaxID=3880 RepID=A0A396IVB6_MEDTR|nr:hypothetical protein MtrunA17_Chr3g0112561 [Medicago truncatula]